MKPKHANRDEGGKTWLRCRSEIVSLLDELRSLIAKAPSEVEFGRESIQGLLMAAYYLLDVNTPFPLVEDTELVRSAIRELQKALGPIGLDLDYWDKIQMWRRRELRESGEGESLAEDMA